MDEPGSDSKGLVDVAEQLALAAVGAVSLTAEKADALADELAERGGMRRDEARAFVRDLVSRWRGDAVRVGERTGAGLQGTLRQLGLVVREEYEELELRVAQLEHRLRLLEGAEAATAIRKPR
jgi:polyhydroxyalkanoate synthesis regulator phasin